MSTLYIREYNGIGYNMGGNIQAPLEPAFADQNISYTGTAGTSAAFNTSTKLIGISSDGVFSYRVSTAGTAATTANFRVGIGVIIFLGVKGGDKISAITNS